MKRIKRDLLGKRDGEEQCGLLPVVIVGDGGSGATKGLRAVNALRHVECDLLTRLPARKGGRDTASKRGRATSPDHYSDSERTRSQSPAGRFYHSDSSAQAASPVGAESPVSEGINLRWPFPGSISDVSPEPYIPKLYDRKVSDDAYLKQKALSDLEEFGPSNFEGTVKYQYVPLLDSEIRLLCISPGSFESRLICSLKVVPLEKLTAEVHEFQALSYAWGRGAPTCEVFLSDVPRADDSESATQTLTRPRTYPIRRNLYQALKHIRLTNDYLWLWVDYLCIEQTNNEEKSQQIPKMPDIYSNAWNVIARLGEYDSHGNKMAAIRLIPDILNLKTLEIHLRGQDQLENLARFSSWRAFGRILQRPWFRRRWVIQEVACARKLSVRIAGAILSWVDFADAVDLYSDNLDQMQAHCRQSVLCKKGLDDLAGTDSSATVALMKFSRNVFQRSRDSAIASRLMSLESLVLTASSFGVSDVRDTVYALLYLANDIHDVIDTSSESRVQHALTSDYSKYPVDIFKDFVRYSIAKSNSLDVLYRQWANWPESGAWSAYKERLIPSWIGVATFRAGHAGLERPMLLESLIEPVGSQVYHTSHGVAFHGQTIPSTIDDVIQLDGMLLETVDTIFHPAVKKAFIWNSSLALLGWRGNLDNGINDQLWRTLVANRNPDSKIAPTWYRRACALALTQLDDSGNLDLAALIANMSRCGNSAYV